MTIDLEYRLRLWAEALATGNGNGYPATSVLHPNWQPPSPGQTPTMKTGPGRDAMATHRAVRALERKAQVVLFVHYVLRWPIAQQAAALQCQERTVYERVRKAKVELLQRLTG
jgi:DNA-directed RNA polymerase specialized sigma24 family protein